MRNFSKYPLLVVVLMMVVAVAAACSGNSDTPNGASNSPEQAVKGFLEGAFTGNVDAIRNNMCAAEQSSADAAAQAYGSMAAAGATVSLEGATYTTSNQTDSTATVTVGGAGKFTMQGQEQPLPLDDLFPPFIVNNENGAWKVCTVAS